MRMIKKRENSKGSNNKGMMTTKRRVTKMMTRNKMRCRNSNKSNWLRTHKRDKRYNLPHARSTKSHTFVPVIIGKMY